MGKSILLIRTISNYSRTKEIIMEIEQVKFDNYSLKIGKEWFMWKVFISKDEPSDKLNKVRNVEYKLPEFFPDPIRLVDNRNTRFALNSTGREEFQIFITVYLEDNTKIPAKVRVDLNKPWPLEELGGVNLSKANIEEANLKGANLEGANLWGANIEGANLEGAKLVEANLKMAKLNRANLKNADLSESTLKLAKLEYSNLEEAKLIGANLDSANLTGVNLKNAKLNNAILSGIKLNSANLSGADFRDVDIKNADLRHAIFDENTDFQGADVKSTTINNLDGSNWWDAKWNPWDREEIEKKYGKK